MEGNLSKDPPLVQAAEKLADAYSSLIRRVDDPGNHGLFRGSMEEAIAASQSAEMLRPSGIPLNHAKNVDQSCANLTKIRSDLGEALREVNIADPIAFFRLDHVLKPSIDYCLNIQEAQSETISLLKLIKPLHGTRLEGLCLETGERTYWSLASVQIASPRHRPFFQSRPGIQPNLYPFLNSKVSVFTEQIRQVPINSHDIYGRLAPMKNAIDREIHASMAQFGRGAPALSIIYGQLKKKL
jgi:hypothetical protein